jgi:hypothetical protein
MSDPAGTGDRAPLLEVRIVQIPVPVWARAQEHGDELLREFALIAEQLRSEGSHSDVPVRLTELVAALTTRYGSLNADQEAQLADAARRGVPEIDLTFEAPAHVVDDVIALCDMLDDADVYCRAGKHLLTLASPPELVRFRNWYLGEFVRQLAGERPMPWPDYPAEAEPSQNGQNGQNGQAG